MIACSSTTYIKLTSRIAANHLRLRGQEIDGGGMEDIYKPAQTASPPIKGTYIWTMTYPGITMSF